MSEETSLLTFGDHLEVLRRMLFRIIGVALALSVVIFCFKTETFNILLAPKSSDFITFRWISSFMEAIGIDFHFEEYNVQLINTELASQFMTHLTTSFILGALLASPFILYELFRFVSPALYDSERKYSVLVALIIYTLFLLGLLMSYYILFPISFRFLATYQVNSAIINTITLDSYITTFISLTFLMGLVFELPVIMFVMGRMGFIDRETMRSLRPYALVVIMFAAAIITPPDIFTMVLVTVPLYLLYELSVLTLQKRKDIQQNQE